jgi:electron transfer flavoprotein-quinone oxidoreductase
MKQHNQRISFDLIVVGAGLAGSSAAAIASKKGLKVGLIERGTLPGTKNIFGGAVYTHALEEIYPDLWERKPPLERPVTESGFWFLAPDGMTRFTVQGGLLSRKPADAHIALKAKFDRWWGEQAEKEGAFLIPKTTVVDFIYSPDRKVIGVVTDRPEGEIFSPVTIVCEGVNNLLTQKLGLIGHDLKPSSVALGCKQLISLPQEKINANFGLPDTEHGLAVSILGDATLGLTGLGFIYTAKDCVSIGLGVNLDKIAEHNIRPYELLQRFINHPCIVPLLNGGKLMEYGAHLIPEGGWHEIPKLCTDGVMVAGDAAAMVNSLHWEGTNMAIIAGKAAAETAIEAHEQHDFSVRILKGYQERLNNRFVMRDLYHYRNFARFLETHPDFMQIYPNILNEAFGMFLSGYGVPKKKLYRDILQSIRSKKPLFRAAGDLFSLGKTVIGR